MENKKTKNKSNTLEQRYKRWLKSEEYHKGKKKIKNKKVNSVEIEKVVDEKKLPEDNTVCSNDTQIIKKKSNSLKERYKKWLEKEQSKIKNKKVSTNNEKNVKIKKELENTSDIITNLSKNIEPFENVIDEKNQEVKKESDVSDNVKNIIIDKDCDMTNNVGRPSKYKTDEERKIAKLESKRQWRMKNKERIESYNKLYNKGKTQMNDKEYQENFVNNHDSVNLNDDTVINNEKSTETKIEIVNPNNDQIIENINKLKPTLILIRGPPGSGKTTIAKTIYNTFEYMSADDYFIVNNEYVFDCTKLRDAHLWCKNNTEKLLRNKKDVIVANTFKTLWELNNYISSFGKVANIIVLRVTSKYNSIHNVPKNIIDSYDEDYQIYPGEKYVRLDLENKRLEFTTLN